MLKLIDPKIYFVKGYARRNSIRSKILTNNRELESDVTILELSSYFTSTGVTNLLLFDFKFLRELPFPRNSLIYGTLIERCVYTGREATTI